MKILLADDHDIIRVGIRSILLQRYQGARIDEANTAAGVLSLFKQHNYDLAFFDVQLSDVADFSLVSQVLHIRPNAKIIIFSMLSETIYGPRFLRSGAKAYLSLDADDTAILKAAEVVLAGMRYVSDSVAGVLMDSGDDATRSPFTTLSNRELEVLHQLLDGASNVSISTGLKLSASTVATHKMHIFEKLGVRSLVELMDLARTYSLR